MQCAAGRRPLLRHHDQALILGSALPSLQAAYPGQLNVFYSTPKAYAEAKLALNITYPVQKAAGNGVDFFPYRDSPHSPWTGACCCALLLC